MKKFQFSIRNKFLLAVFLGCLFPYVVGGIYLKDTLEKQLYASNAEHTGQLLSQVQQFFDKTLVENMSNKVDYLASLAAVKSGRDGLLDYTGFKGSDPLQPPGPLEASISPLFETMKFSNKSINFVFFGTESGGYMEYPRFVPLNAYDPRLRPWYVATKTEAKLVMSEPYITNTTNDLVVSFTKPVVQEGAMVGVVGLTVRLDELMNSVAGVRLGKTGSIWVLSPDRHFMLSPLNREWIMHTPDELGLSGLSSLGYGDAASFEGVVEGRTLLMRTLVSEQSGLYFVAAMDKAEVLSQATVVTNLFVGMYSLTFALVVALIFWISNRMTGSILVFAQVIRRMTDFEFRLEDNREIMGYAKTKDEIGVVASSLVELHNNFYELMKQVRWLDEEIKTLEVEDGAALTLEVSEQNPFSGVVSSMNGLLDRMREYVAKLRSSTEELGEKNGLLVVSEGKLHSQLEQIKEKNEYIHYLAYHDSLTGLPNRRKFVEELTNKLADGQSGAVVLLDIDDFKGINDTLGHVFGDKVLVRIATLLLEIQEEGMFVSRFGGDEYLLLLECESEECRLQYFLEKIAGIFAGKIVVDGTEVDVRFSIGVAEFPIHGQEVNQLVMQADLAMYSVKNSGKNSYRSFDEGMMEDQVRRSSIESLIWKSLEEDGFFMVYQPKVSLKTGEIVGYEALVRMRDCFFSPAEFIPVAEGNGSIVKLGRQVALMVVRQMAVWQEAGMVLRPVSINFSGNQLQDVDFVSFLEGLLLEYGVAASLIEIEITENIFLDDKAGTMEFLHKIKKLGMGISIDDFGTGYSSLNYLTFLPADVIKLDRSLIVKFLEFENPGVLDSMVSLVHSLGLKVVAEGVESWDQIGRLCASHCDFVQGFVFSKPIGAEEVPEFNGRVFELE